MGNLIIGSYRDPLPEETGSDPYIGKVVLPEGMTKIKDMQFFRSERMTSVKIPDSVTSIGDMAFLGCSHLTEIVIPPGVTTIGSNAFQDCKNLRKIVIPESVTSIGNLAFEGTPWQEEYPDDFVIVNQILVRYKGSAETVTLPESVKEIQESAFFRCERIKWIPVLIADGNPICIADSGLYHIISPREYSRIRSLVLRKNYSVSMFTGRKYDLIAQMFLYDLDPDGTVRYIRKHFTNFFMYLIIAGHIKTIRKILDSGKFLLKRNMDEYLKYAIANQKHEIYLLLIEYKQKHDWYQTPGQNLEL